MMSSVASTLNASSTLITMDFVRRWRPDLPDRTLVKISRYTTIVVAILAVVFLVTRGPTHNDAQVQAAIENAKTQAAMVPAAEGRAHVGARDHGTDAS